MIVNLGELTDVSDLGSEVVLVGGGAVGITLAAALSDKGIGVTMLEAGGVDFSSYDPHSFEGQVDGLPYDLLRSRQRSLGGATNRWFGWSRPLEDLVFEQRKWIGDTGWPLTAKDLSPWYRKAHRFMKLGQYDWDSNSVQERIAPQTSPVGEFSNIVTSPLWRFFPDPLQFQNQYADVLERPNVKVVVNAPVVDFELKRGRATSAIVVAPSTTRVKVPGKHFFLGMGGIENLRMLLVLQETAKEAGIRLDRSGWLGRGWMEHPHVQTGALVVPDSIASNELLLQSDFRMDGDTRVVAGFGLSQETLKAEKMPFASFSIFNPYSEDTNPLQHVEAVRQATSQLTGSDSSVRSMYARSESRVVRNSRVRVLPQTDRYGTPITRLTWRVNPRDYEDLYLAQRILAKEFARLGIGVIAEDPRPLSSRIEGGNHHIGGARMAKTAKEGVTNPYGQLFSIPNISVTGSALLPTGGFSNPTMTIVALALMQAAHYADGADD